MEVFIHNIPSFASKDDLQTCLQPVLKSFLIYQFHCTVLRKGGCGKFVILDRPKGQLFLTTYGSDHVSDWTLSNQVLLGGKRLVFRKSRNEPPDDIVQALEIMAGLRPPPSIGPAVLKTPTSHFFGCSSIDCGIWDYVGKDPVFISHHRIDATWELKLQKYSCLITGSIEKRSFAMEFRYENIHMVTCGEIRDPCLTFTLTEAPKILGTTRTGNNPGDDMNLDQLVNLLSSLRSGNRTSYAREERVLGLDKQHEQLISSCLNYRLSLRNPQDYPRLMQSIQNNPSFPPFMSHCTSIRTPEISFHTEMVDLSSALARRATELPYLVRFQMQRLAQNGFLRPRKLHGLISVMMQITARSGPKIAADALKRLYNQIEYSGPQLPASEVSRESLAKFVIKNEESLKWEQTFTASQGESDQSALFHRAIVTPAGIYLDGPNLETKNRVVRKYPNHHDHFLRVVFCEENFEPMFFDRDVSYDKVLDGRYKKVLDGSIDIAGLSFRFLGFSHSSLRARSCWFMAPFYSESRLLLPDMVIGGLGDFTKIRSPARCAARIGQAFSNTLTSVELPTDAFKQIPDVVRNGSTFSDGVGTFSSSIWHKILARLEESDNELEANVFQIRYAGAKGVISYDPTLSGDALHLRPSMIKFESLDTTLEICSRAKALPLYLNRQYIKIMEDLGVPEEIFLAMQKKEIERLRHSASSAKDASAFLERQSVGKGAKLSYLIRKLHQIGLSFKNDGFLFAAVEMSILLQLRQIKYRSRIFVDQGVTLVGIMDETNDLNEGEVYCTWRTKDNKKMTLIGTNVVARSPALHPGDFQRVVGISPPVDSSLLQLENCLVFSQQGSRCLPSQLSGGDLDGDLYSVFYDHALFPEHTVEPAAYPKVDPIDIGRPVDRSDMTAFFIDFMKSDQLGRIANLHLHLADASPLGTKDPLCLQVAALHSDAVDFSKTGRPVDLKRLPRPPSQSRPDYMASGPRIQLEDQADFEEDSNNAQSTYDDDRKHARTFYESKKVLGKLFREIDEKQFLKDLRETSKVPEKLNSKRKQNNLIYKLWEWMEPQVSFFNWADHVAEAQRLRDSWEENIRNLMMEYSIHPRQTPQELEIFLGALIDRDGKQTRRQREYSIDLKQRIDREISEYVEHFILKGAGENYDGTEESILSKCIACVAVAAELGNRTARQRPLRSWDWIVAAVCLKRMDECELFD